MDLWAETAPCLKGMLFLPGWTSDPLWRSLILSIVPLLLGAILINGILESYKNDSSAHKEILNDFYRPMRETQADCQKTHNNLFLKCGEISGSYQLMLEEFKHLSTAEPSKMAKEYQILLEFLLTAHTKANADAKDIEAKLELCRTKLFRQYGELALITGTYKKFDNLARTRALRINELYAAHKATSEKTLKNYDVKDLMGMLREFLQLTFETQEQKSDATQKLNEFGAPIIQHYLQLSANVQEMFKVDTQFFEDLHDIFSTEISSRFERGFIARLFF